MKLTISGETYEIAAGVKDGTDAVVVDDFANTDKNFNYYVDQYGYVVYTDAIAEETNYAVVDKIALINSTGTGTNQLVEAVLAFADGTSETVNVSKINGIKATDIENDTAAVTTDSSNVVTALEVSSTVGSNTALCGVPVSYKVVDGKYELTYLNLNANLNKVEAQASIFAKVATSTSAGKVSTGTVVPVTVVEKGVPTVVGYGKTDAGDASASVKADNNTKYLVKTLDGNRDAKFSAYTGFKNVATVKLTGVKSSSTETPGDSATAKVSYALNDDNDVAFVYIDATNANATVGDIETGDMLYVTSTTYTTHDTTTNGVYYTLKGIVNGVEDVELKTKTETIFSTGLEKGKLYELNVDNDGYVTAKTEQTTGGAEAYIKVTLSADAKNGNVGGYTYDGSEKVIVIDDYAVVDGTVESAKNGDVVYIEVVDKAGTASEQVTVETIYVIKAAV